MAWHPLRLPVSFFWSVAARRKNNLHATFIKDAKALSVFHKKRRETL
jgi:hypothetical protein